MIRREFITLLGGAVASWPLAARAQQGVRRIGVLTGLADDADTQAHMEAFLQGLAQLGWTEGRNLRIDTRWTAGDADRGRRYAAEFVALAPDVILASGSSVLAPLLQATRTVPIVFTIVADPVGAGFVDSLAEPGGNATGFTPFEYGLSAKWLELLKQIAPGVTRAAVLRDPAITSGIGQFAVIQSVAPSVGVDVRPINVRDPAEIERAVAAFCALAEWWSDRDGERVDDGSSRSDHHACGPVPTSRDLLRAPLRHQRRSDHLWIQFRRAAPASGQLRRSHSQGRKARRLTSAGANQIRADHQP